jgi:cobalt/nickel transport system permease protein
MRDFRSLESIAARTSALSALDARAKILVTFGFILTVVSFDRYTVAALLPLALFPVMLMHMGNIPPRVIGRGILLASPFAFMMGIFNPLFDNQPMMTVGGYGISGGWVSFVSILVRFALTVSVCLVLVAGTGFNALCDGLRRLGLPQVFTNQLLLLHRYAIVLIDEATRMNLARELRAAGKAMPLSVYGPLLGHFLLRALQRAQRIHQAMLSRGFSGSLQLHSSSRWQRHETLFVSACVLCFGLARQVDLSKLIGHLVLRLTT